jgi:hypothetical protein
MLGTPVVVYVIVQLVGNVTATFDPQLAARYTAAN